MSGEPQRFITLTSRRSTSVSPAQAAKRIVAAFQTVVLRWRRLKPGNTCDYLAVFEATKLGWPHLHVLWRGAYIDQRWLSAQMRELNGSPIVDVRKVSGAREAARYIAKYIGKGPGKFGTCKRYWQSRGYQLHRQDWRASAIFPGLKPRLVRGPLVEVHASWVYLGKDPSPIINERTRFGEWPPEQARPPPAWREWVT